MCVMVEGEILKAAEIVAAIHATSQHRADTRFWSGPCLTAVGSESVQSAKLLIN